jgi:cation transport ATPase
MTLPEEEPMHTDLYDQTDWDDEREKARQAAVDHYFHQPRRERHARRDNSRSVRRLSAILAVILLPASYFAYAGAFGAENLWYLTKVGELLVATWAAVSGWLLALTVWRGRDR